MDVTSLNMNIGGKPVPGYQGDGHEIEEFCKVLGAPLPASYLDFIRQADGGHPEVGAFSLEGQDELDFDVDCFYSFTNEGIEKVIDAYNEWKSFIGEKMFPIGRDGGGGQILLDLKSVPETVFFLEEGAVIRLHKVATGFSKFIEKLAVNPDFI